jgi:hypothetical protein
MTGNRSHYACQWHLVPFGLGYIRVFEVSIPLPWVLGRYSTVVMPETIMRTLRDRKTGEVIECMCEAPLSHGCNVHTGAVITVPVC